jgi:hypothetical protein
VGCPLPRGTTNIRRLYQQFASRQAAIQNFYAAKFVNFTAACGNEQFAFQSRRAAGKHQLQCADHQLRSVKLV